MKVKIFQALKIRNNSGSEDWYDFSRPANQLYDRNCFENVTLPLYINSMTKHDSNRRVRAALDKVGLLNKEKMMPISLSGGEQQRLAIARAIVSRPKLLIADEPTANLDLEYADEIMNIFYSFQQVGVTVIISTHELGPVINHI